MAEPLTSPDRRSCGGKRAAKTIARSLLAGEWPILLVGSSRMRPRPRDIDLVLVLPDAEFERIFGSTATWAAEGASGAWTNVRFAWSDVCVALSGLLAGRLNSARPIDCKVIPARLPDYGKRTPGRRLAAAPGGAGR